MLMTPTRPFPSPKLTGRKVARFEGNSSETGGIRGFQRPLGWVDHTETNLRWDEEETMIEVSRSEAVAHLRTVDEEGLLEIRSWLFDVAEDEESDVDRQLSVRASLALVDAERVRRGQLRGLRAVFSAAGMEGSADAFAEALLALVRARRELDIPLDADVLVAALEIAKQANEQGDG